MIRQVLLVLGLVVLLALGGVYLLYVLAIDVTPLTHTHFWS